MRALADDNRATGDEAEAAGRAAFRAGLPCEAPDYGRESWCARWRIGWRKERASHGQRDQAHSVPSSTIDTSALDEAVRRHPAMLKAIRQDMISFAIPLYHPEWEFLAWDQAHARASDITHEYRRILAERERVAA